MSLSSAVTLLRGFVVASILTLYDFGLYATLVAIAVFGSSLLGAGAIEATMKIFPRAWASGWGQQMCNRADQLLRLIVARSALVTVVASAVSIVAGYSDWFVMIVLGVTMATGTAAMGIYASAIRSTGNLPSLGKTTLYRTIMAFVLAIAGAYFGGGLGAICGEMIAASVGAMIARRESIRLVRTSVKQESDSPEMRLLLESEKGGRWLLLGTIAVSLPMYLDRLFVAGVIGTEAAGQYGFLMLLVTGAVTVAGIVVQKVGPSLVHAQHAGASVLEQWRIAQTWLIGMVVVVCLGTAIAWLLLIHGPLELIGQRYKLDGIYFLATAALGSLQGVVLLEWILLSRNQEVRVFLAAAGYILFITFLAVWLALIVPTVLQVLTCLIIAKMVHVALQSVLIISLPSKPLGLRRL